MKNNKEELEALIDKCFAELTAASIQQYDVDKAERTAAMFLAAQIQLAYFISEIELSARHSKNEIQRIEAEKYFQVKDENLAKKLTENTLTAAIAKHTDVTSAKRAHAEAEADLKKFNYVMSMLKDGVYFFRGIGKAKWND